MRSLERDAATLLARLDERVRTVERNRSRLTTDVVDGTYAVPGPEGPQGARGAVGARGDRGATGNTGPAGPAAVIFQDPRWRMIVGP